MAKLLKVRGTKHDPNDRFESLLLLTLRGPVVFEGLWNDEIEFSESQWNELVENHWDNDQRPEGVLMRCTAKMPLYVLRGRKMLKGEAVDPTLVQEVSISYNQLLDARATIAKKLDEWQTKIDCAGAEVGVLLQIQDAIKRIDSFFLGVVIIAGCILGAVSEFTPELQATLNRCAAGIYAYVPWCQKLRPLGSCYMLLSLSMAYTGADDPDLKYKLQEAFLDLHRDFPADADSISVLETLQTGGKKFLSLGVAKRDRLNSERSLGNSTQMDCTTYFEDRACG